MLVVAVNKRLKLSNGSVAADDLDQALEHGVALGRDALRSLAAHKRDRCDSGWLARLCCNAGGQAGLGCGKRRRVMGGVIRQDFAEPDEGLGLTTD